MAERGGRHEPSFKDNADRWREITSNDSCESYRRFIRHRRTKCVKVAGYNGMTRDNGASTFNDSDNSKGSIRFELNFSLMLQGISVSLEERENSSDFRASEGGKCRSVKLGNFCISPVTISEYCV